MTAQEIMGRPIWVMAKGYTPDEGGMQTYAQAVAEAYAAAGADVTVFTQTSAGPRELNIDNCRVVDIGPVKGLRVLTRFLSRLRKSLKSGSHPVFVHGTTWRTSVIPMLLGLPYITTFHGREFMYPSGVVLAVMRKVAATAKAVIAVSHYSADKLAPRLGLPAHDIAIAWNGIGFSPKLRLRPMGAIPLLFTLCRLEPRKNVQACVHACAAMKQRGLAFHYVIAGRGPELETVRSLVTQLDLDDCIEVAGFVHADRAAQLYADCDIFLHPQIRADDGRDFEGFGIAIADAMIAESAVIVGSDGGSVELVENGVSGIALDGTDQSAIHTALADLLVDESQRRVMASAAKERAQSLFTWDRHIDTVLAALRTNQTR